MYIHKLLQYIYNSISKLILLFTQSSKCNQMVIVYFFCNIVHMCHDEVACNAMYTIGAVLRGRR